MLFQRIVLVCAIGFLAGFAIFEKRPLYPE